MQEEPTAPFPLRVAIVHDALVNRGGAERTLTFMCEAFPDAPVFTSVYLPDRTYPEFSARLIHTLPGTRWVHTERGTKQLLPLWIAGFHYLDLAGFDVVLSSSTWSAKFIRHPHHVCYCYAPFRVLWKPQSYSNQSLPIGRALQAGMNVIRPMLRRVDSRVMQRIPRIATSCQNMAREIREAYQRDARVIYPPVRVANYAVNDNDMEGDYYLTVSRLISYKRIDLAVHACRTLGRKLVIVGEGPEYARLQAIADESIYFTGPVSDAKLKDLYRNCRAVIFPSHEDYGIVPIEAQASGRPVVAYGVGGALETIVENETGVFFYQQTTEAVVSALQKLEDMHFSASTIRLSAKRFDVERFKQDIKALVLEAGGW